jgi:voltage-gated potassium channel
MTHPHEMETHDAKLAWNWTVGISASITMVVAVFLPWFDGELWTRGVTSPEGLVLLALSVVAVCAQLVRQRWLALALVVACSVYSIWLIPQFDVQWGLYVFVTVSVLAAISCASVGSAANTRAGTDTIKRWLDRKLNPGDDDSKVVDTFIITLIGINVLLVIVETEPGTTAYKSWFEVCEAFSTIIFTVEYVLRLWIAPLNPKYQRLIKGRLQYAATPMALVDFVAIAPFFLIFLESLDLRIARAIRLMRLLRILKIGRYARAIRTLSNTVSRKKEELAISTFVSSMVLVLSSSAMYFVEHGANGDPEHFRSIPATMWWAVVTLTSVGYGDMSPITPLGMMVGAIVCTLGVLLVALPTGILASGFLEEMREQQRGKDSDVFGYCPHCGKKLIPGEELE